MKAHDERLKKAKSSSARDVAGIISAKYSGSALDAAISKHNRTGTPESASELAAFAGNLKELADVLVRKVTGEGATRTRANA